MSQKPSLKAVATSVSPNERRSACRYSVVHDQAWLGWWEGTTFKSLSAKLVDVSFRGALLQVKALPPVGVAAWFRLPDPVAPEEWIEAKVVGTRKKLFGPQEVRVMFRKSFSYEAFKALIYGPDTLKEIVPPTWFPQQNEERDWW